MSNMKHEEMTPGLKGEMAMALEMARDCNYGDDDTMAFIVEQTGASHADAQQFLVDNY